VTPAGFRIKTSRKGFIRSIRMSDGPTQCSLCSKTIRRNQSGAYVWWNIYGGFGGNPKKPALRVRTRAHRTCKTDLATRQKETAAS
jgi:hypothetical protein